VELRPSPAGSQTQNISNFSADVDEWRWTRAGGNGSGSGPNATTSHRRVPNPNGHPPNDPPTKTPIQMDGSSEATAVGGQMSIVGGKVPPLGNGTSSGNGPENWTVDMPNGKDHLSRRPRGDMSQEL